MNMQEKVLELKQMFVDITSGYRFIDKLVLGISTAAFLLSYPVNKILSIIGIIRFIPPADFYFADVQVKNSDGIFLCRKRSIDITIIRDVFESKLKKYFSHTNESFVDVGAHIGKYTIRMAKKLEPGNIVVAIEAHPDNFSTLKRNIKLNGLINIIPVNMACLNRKGTVKLYEAKSSGRHSVEKINGQKYRIIKADKLDNILKKANVREISFIKIDVEGAEEKVLQGATRVLSKMKPSIIFETWDNEKLENCKRILQKKGYSIKKTSEPGYYIAKR